jgi:ABC-type glutathione transport system ATPase component
MGSGMEALFGAYKVDIGIYGVAGVDEDGTLLDFYEEEVRARQMIRENCRSAYLVLDHTKFGRAAHVRGGKIDEATIIFCDRMPPASIRERIARSGAQLIVCKWRENPHEPYRYPKLAKQWGAVVAVDQVSFTVAEGSLTVLLGPSGCGKSTILRLIAGLENVSSGSIAIGGNEVTHMDPAKRGVSMVFQSYALFPHLNVRENILFGLKVRGISQSERRSRLEEAAHMVGLEDLLNRKACPAFWRTAATGGAGTFHRVAAAGLSHG